MRIIFFAGKGGVGKTSVAAATGIKTAQAGHKTLVMSLDVAHSLSDIFDLERSLIDQNRGRPLRVRKNLWIQELDILEEIEKNWGDIHKYISTLLNTTGLDEILAEELAILPGMEEVSLLLYINRYAQTKEFDVILLDCAPTGESLRFISIPTTLEWYIKKIFKMERTLVRYARPIAKRLYDVPLPGEDYFDAVEFLFNRLRGVDEILIDPEITTVRLITNPEKIVLKETQRAFMYFCLYKMNIDGIIMNRVLPETVHDAYFQDWRESQRQYIKNAETYFSPIPLFSVNLFRGEILGQRSLKALADEIYGDRNPLDRFFDGKPYSLIKANGKYQLRVKVPFIEKKDVELSKISDELIVRVGSFKRHILLPRQVAASKSVRAKLDGEYLSVHFEP
ncbi:MAG: ArsA family ATPase [Desulfobacterales bacterium]|nr:ArsA family ATPase [Desulfobacterales bacterium]MBL7101407.1 ArsA family ATPase [Desulfobacteraceae bacterium]MBL7171528.1 ArsA family ATPase [Desulfobacteraceae bacterium]